MEYEGLHIVYYYYGCYGYISEICAAKIQKLKETIANQLAPLMMDQTEKSGVGNAGDNSQCRRAS